MSQIRGGHYNSGKHYDHLALGPLSIKRIFPPLAATTAAEEVGATAIRSHVNVESEMTRCGPFGFLVSYMQSEFSARTKSMSDDLGENSVETSGDAIEGGRRHSDHSLVSNLYVCKAFLGELEIVASSVRFLLMVMR